MMASRSNNVAAGAVVPPGREIPADWRDEIREVGCGLYLVRLYSVCSHEFRGYLALVPQGCR